MLPVLCLLGHGLASGNLVRNGSFEKGLASWDAYGFTGVIRHEKAADGRHVFSAVLSPRAKQKWAQLSQKINLVPGKRYHFSAWLDAPNRVPCAIELKLYSQGNLICHKRLERDANAMSGFMEVTTNFALPPAMASPVLEIFLGMYNNKKPVYLDHVQLRELAPGENPADLERITPFTGKIQLTLSPQKAYLVQTRYRGDNGLPSGLFFDNSSRYLADIMYNFLRTFSGFGGLSLGDTIKSHTPGSEEALQRQIRQIVESPQNNPILPLTKLDELLRDQVALRPDFINFLLRTHEARRLGIGLLQCTGPWWPFPDQRFAALCWEDWVKSYAHAYILARTCGITDFNPLNEPDHKGFRGQWEKYVREVGYTASALRAGVKAAGFPNARIWAPTFASSDAAAADLIAQEGDDWIDVYDWHQYHSNPSAYYHAYRDWQQRVNRIDKDGIREPLATSEFNYTLSYPPGAFDQVPNCLRKLNILSAQLRAGLWASLRFAWGELFVRNHITGTFYRPYKLYYAIRMFNRMALPPAEYVPLSSRGNALHQQFLATRNSEAYFILFVNAIKNGLSTLDIDLQDPELSTTAQIRFLDRQHNDEATGSVAVSQGRLRLEKLPPQSAVQIVIPRKPVLPSPVVHRAFATEKGIELWWRSVRPATSYRIERRCGNATWQPVADKLNHTYYLDLHPPAGQPLYYRVIPEIGEAMGRPGPETGPCLYQPVHNAFPRLITGENSNNWKQVCGKWRFTQDDTLRIVPQTTPQKCILIADPSPLQGDFMVRTAFSLRKAGKDAGVGLVFGYRTLDDYWLILLNGKSRKIELYHEHHGTS
ncbi:MAG: hypothetical protein D6820_04900, partial [Lentisphaerae bacterium]